MTANTTESIITNRQDLRDALNIMLHVRSEAYKALWHEKRKAGQQNQQRQEELDDYYQFVRAVEDYLLGLCLVYGEKNPAAPGCRECMIYSVTGGPGHDASDLCRSGKRPHCTCSACF